MLGDIIENSPRRPRRGPHLQAHFLVGARPAQDMPSGCIGAFSRPRRHRPACVSGCPDQAEAPESVACGSRTHRHSVRMASPSARQTDARRVSVPAGERRSSGAAHATALHHHSSQRRQHSTPARTPVMRLPPRSRMQHSTRYVDSTRCHDGMGYCVTRHLSMRGVSPCHAVASRVRSPVASVSRNRSGCSGTWCRPRSSSEFVAVRKAACNAPRQSPHRGCA